eukprot:gb/GECH01009940.1/.p1 GENE.gb/GECH01009940.1/~~gb/GECH01009940.1/.p1  ORF type:complete len:512 (+),score=150.44 gb/GECH01009940.1/:1-1536(+)
MSFFNIDEVLNSAQGTSSQPTLEVSSFLSISPAATSSVFRDNVNNAFNRFTTQKNITNNNSPVKTNSHGYLQRTWNFIKRHKKKFIGAGVVVGGFSVSFLYLYYRYQQIVQDMRREELNAARMRIHFGNNKRTALSAVRSQLLSVEKFLQESLELQSITPELKNKNLSSEEKLNYWNQYKRQSLIKTVTSIYAISFMYVLLSVQLHIIGRYLFLKYISDEEKRRPVGSSSEAITLSSDVQQQFLSYIAHFQSSGINLIFQRVSSAVDDVISHYDLRSEISADTARNIIDSIRDSVEGLVLDDTNNGENMPRWNLTTILLPPFTDQPSSSHEHTVPSHQTFNIDQESGSEKFNKSDDSNEEIQEKKPEEDDNDENENEEDDEEEDDDNSLPPPPVSYAEMPNDLKLLVDELISILQSDEFSSIMDAALSSVFSLFTDSLESAIARKSQSGKASESEYQDPSVFLAIILPYIAKQSDHIISSSQDNDYLACLYQVESLNQFCAKVYSGEYPQQ